MARARSAGVVVAAGPHGDLRDVTAASANDVWAVGCTGRFGCASPLVVHWNGTSWAQVPFPRLRDHRDFLYGVAATSARDVWVVGFQDSKNLITTLIAHWNGRSWTQLPSPSPLPRNQPHVLTSVVAVSARDAWAVGYYGNAGKTLIVHWNGTSWTRVPSPDPGAVSNVLFSVAATSARSAWAAGYYAGHVSKTLIVHWNGTSWAQQHSPNPAEQSHIAGDALYGVTATSARNAWAVGSIQDNSRTLTVHWDGTSWTRVPSPTPPRVGGIGSILSAVTATSARRAWAVGATGTSQYLIQRWTGAAWQPVHVLIPGLGPGWDLVDVTATSAHSAWGVGFTGPGEPLIMHWDGTAWTQAPTPTAGPR